MLARSWGFERKSNETRVLPKELAAAMSSTSRATLEPAIARAVQAIENHGCSTEFVSRRMGSKRTTEAELKVLSLDLVWLSPGPLGSWSQRGQQACYCLRGEGAARQKEPSWYQRALKEYFSSHNCRSLLTYPDIFTRPIFLEVSFLTDSEIPPPEPDQRLPALAARPPHAIWHDEFEPDPHPEQSAQEWQSRFEHFRRLLRDELRSELGTGWASDAILAWVYVSAGASQPDDAPPPWAASMFLLFRFKGLGNLQRGPATIDRDLNLLLSNLSHALQAASQKALPDPAKHDIAQALAHEFKNLNQDVAVLAHLAMRDYMSLPPWLRSSEFDPLRERLNALHVAAQATTAFSMAAYWLAAPNWQGIELRPDDEKCSIFKHVLFLAIRLIAQTREKWTLVGIPELRTIVDFLDERLRLVSDGNATRLLSNRCISIMAFFALEPVRNIRSNSAEHPEVRVSVETGRRHVILSHQTLEIGQDECIAISETIKALMRITRDNARLTEFIHIEPDVEARFEATAEPKVFSVRRRTTIRVEQIPYPVSLK